MMGRLRDSRGRQFLLISTLILIIPLMADISGRMSVLRRMHQEKARLTQELIEVTSEQEALKARLKRVNDEVYLEQWARVDARLTKPGEVAFIPIFADQIHQNAPQLDDDFPSPGTTASIPEKWHRLFLDDSENP